MTLASLAPFYPFMVFPSQSDETKAETELVTSIVFGHYGKSSLWCLGTLTPVPEKLEDGIYVSPYSQLPLVCLQSDFLY